MVVVGEQRPPDAEMREQFAAMTAVLGGNAVGAGEHFPATVREIGEIADGSRHHVKTACFRHAENFSRELVKIRKLY